MIQKLYRRKQKMDPYILFFIIVFVAIIAMVLLNKLLDYLSARFPISYNIVSLIAAGVAFGLSFICPWINVSFTDFWKNLGLLILGHFIYFYLLLTDIDEVWTKETHTAYRQKKMKLWDLLNGEPPGYEPYDKETEHYSPAWWRKLLICLGLSVAALFLVASDLSYVALILEALIPLIIIIRQVISYFKK